MDAEFHPRDCVVRLNEDGVFKGSTWYHITDDEIRYEGLTREEGRIAGQLDIDRTVRRFLKPTRSTPMLGWWRGLTVRRGRDSTRFTTAR